MFSKLMLKSCLVLSSLWFTCFLLLIVIGIVANAFGMTEGFYCGFYCKFGLSLYTVVSLFFVGYFVKNCKR